MAETPLVGKVADLVGAAANATTRKTGSALDKDAFLSLLVTQLKNQDPMKPMEDSQFIGQMAQFSSLEQMQNLNKTMEAQAHFQNLSSASGLIGKTVTLVDKDLGNVSGKVTEVRQKDDKLNVVIDGKEFDSTTITGVAAPAAAAAASGTTPTGT